MKKIILLGAIPLISFSAFAQSPYMKHKPVRYRTIFGVKAGATFANVSVSAGSSPSAITSLYVGGTINVPVYKALSIESGLTLVGKGFNQLESQAVSKAGSTVISAMDKSSKSTPWYLELPVSVVAHLDAGPGKLLLGFGPYLGVGLFGKQEITMTGKTLGSTTTVNSQITELKYSGNNRSFNPLDFGLNFLMGYQLTNGFNLHFGYGLGLINISPDATDAQSVKNSVFTVGLGYMFR